MFKDYTKGLYKTLFGSTSYHGYGYGFACGFEQETPLLKPTVALAASASAAVIGLFLGGPLVGLVAGLITALVVYSLYTDALALAAGSSAKDRKDATEQKSPLLSALDSGLQAVMPESIGYKDGTEAGKDAHEELSPYCLSFA